MFQNLAFLEIPRNLFLTRVAGLTIGTGCNITKIELLSKFFKDVLKIWEMS